MNKKDNTINYNVPNSQFKNFLSFFEKSPGRLIKYIELLTLKNNATTIATTDKKSLGEVGVVINTKCNLKCVWCHEKKSISKIVVILREMVIKKN